MTTNSVQPQILRRSVRFSINADESVVGANGFAGKPSVSGLGRYYEMTISIRGVPDERTGYLLGIQTLDSVVRDRIVPAIRARIQEDPKAHPGAVLDGVWGGVQDGLDHELVSLSWKLAPYYCVEMTHALRQTPAVLLRERFEFAAAHRLHSPRMSDEENARFFGRCNNANGHGHNYQLEPCVRVAVGGLGAMNHAIEIQQLVNSILLDQLDHKFLNTDCDWFNQSIGGVIPSVENIARVCFERLAPAVSDLGSGVGLVSVTVWETEKTSSIYPAPAL